MNPVTQERKADHQEASGHPAEAMAVVVFEACCRTLAALREPVSTADLASPPDEDFANHLAKRRADNIEPPPAKVGTSRHRGEYGAVLWENLAEMERDRRPKPSAEQSLERIRALAKENPEKLLEYVRQMDGGGTEREPESPVTSSRPFGLATVIEWLERADLLERNEDTIRGKPECYESGKSDYCLGLTENAVAKVFQWATGEDAPPAKRLSFCLRTADSKPGFKREVLLVQGIQGGVETMAALLNVLPLWTKSRRDAFEGIVLKLWLRWTGRSNEPKWRSELHAGLTDRWLRLLDALENVPRSRDKSSSPSGAPGLIGPMFLVKTPKEIQRELDEHVVGQDEAKRQIATLVHYQTVLRMREGSDPDLDLPKPAPMLLAGPTGCGKTLLVSTACRLTGLPFVHVDASQMVPEGIVGTSINDIGKQLLVQFGDYDGAIESVRHAVVFFDEIDKLNQSQHGREVIHQLLSLLEGGSIPLNEGCRGSWKPPAPTLPCKDMLFILGGAFQSLFDKAGEATIGFGGRRRSAGTLGLGDLGRAGFPSEFLGRIHRWVVMPPLDVVQLESILVASKSSPLIAVNELLGLHRFRLALSKASARRIANAAVGSGYGARALHQIIHEIAEPWLFDAPHHPGKTHRITAKEAEVALARLETKGAFSTLEI